jgi:hypothetical protein
MTLVRVKVTDSGGGFAVLNLRTVTRIRCSGFDGEQEEHRATVFFPDGAMMDLAGADADRVVSALEDLAGHPLS